MPGLASHEELLRSLGRLVRGLSAIFWGLPLTLVLGVRTFTNDFLRPIDLIPPVLGVCLLVYGLQQLGGFQRQERIWNDTLDRAKLMAVVLLGFSPFLYFYAVLPQVEHFSLAFGLMLLSAVLFLFNLNKVLQRLAAMLPDETLRSETRTFGNLNLGLLCLAPLLAAVYLSAMRMPHPHPLLLRFLEVVDVVRQPLAILLLLMPLSMTMTLVWKIKEVVFHSVFPR